MRILSGLQKNDAYGVDAVQVITGCSLGKGNLIYRGTGKQAYSFFKCTIGEKVRIVFKQLLNRDAMDRDAFQEYILTAPIDDLFEFKEPKCGHQRWLAYLKGCHAIAVEKAR